MAQRSRLDNLKSVIFDCDGVLFDSYRSNVAYYSHILEQMDEGVLTPEEERLCHVYSTTQVFTHLFPDNPEKVRRALHISKHMDYLPFIELMEPEPELHNTLLALRERYVVALATNRGVTVDALLERYGLTDAFDVVATILNVANPKPAPDLLLYCLQQTHLEAHEAVYVGDMDNDRIAAESIGMPFILKGDSIDYPLRIQHLAEITTLLPKAGGKSL